MIGLLIIAIKIIMKNGKDISQKLFGVNFQSAIVPSTEKTTGHGNPAPEDSETGRNSNMMGNQTPEEIEAERLSNIKAKTATMRHQFRKQRGQGASHEYLDLRYWEQRSTNPRAVNANPKSENIAVHNHGILKENGVVIEKGS